MHRPSPAVGRSRPGQAQTGPSRRPALAAAVVAAVANCSFLAAGLAGSALSWGTSMVSELSVGGQPAAWFFRVGDAVAGGGCVVVAALLARHGHRLMPALLAVFGLGTLVSAFVPLTCSPAADPSCPTGDSTAVDVLHDGLSILATTAALAGLWLLWWAGRGGAHSRWRLALAVAGCALGVAQASFVVPHVPVDAGWAQRAQIVVVSAWIVLAAAGDRPRRGAGRDR